MNVLTDPMKLNKTLHFNQFDHLKNSGEKDIIF